MISLFFCSFFFVIFLFVFLDQMKSCFIFFFYFALELNRLTIGQSHPYLPFPLSHCPVYPFHFGKFLFHFNFVSCLDVLCPVDPFHFGTFLFDVSFFLFCCVPSTFSFWVSLDPCSCSRFSYLTTFGWLLTCSWYGLVLFCSFRFPFFFSFSFFFSLFDSSFFFLFLFILFE